MKFYEIVINYSYVEANDANNNALEQKNSKITLHEKKIEKLISEPRYIGEDKWITKLIMQKTNNILLKKNDKDKSAYVYVMGDGEMRIIVRIVDEVAITIKKYINNICNILSGFENQPMANRYDEKHTIINFNKEVNYQEISQTSYFIEKIGFTTENYYGESTDLEIKSFMEKMELYDYSVQDLASRSRNLYLDFATSYYVGEKLSKEELIEKYNDLMSNEDFAKEINRIYEGKDNGESHIMPIHYKIVENDKMARQRYYECLGRALYSTGRIKNKIATTIKCAVDGMPIRPASFKLLMQNSAGSMVSFETINVDDSHWCRWVFDDYPMSFMTDVLRDNKDKVQYVFNFTPYTEKFENEVLENLSVPIIEIKNEVGQNSIIDIVRKMLDKQNLEIDEDLIKRIKILGGKASIKVLTNIIEDWKSNKVIKEKFPEYEEFYSKEGNTFKYEDPYKELMNMVGLENVKKQIDEIICSAKLEKMKKEKFIEEKKMNVFNEEISPLYNSLNMAFIGSAGTAKSTVGRLFAKILYQKGIIRSPKTIFFNQEDSKSIEKAFKAAKGGVLFIDEAYQYTDSIFVPTLVEMMELYRNDVMVIVAGYKTEMKYFLASNSGFESRIKYKIEFEDYDEDELWQILLNMLAKMNLKIKENDIENIKDKLMPVFSSAQLESQFGNGRLVRNILDTAKAKMAIRISNDVTSLENKTYDELTTLIANDFDMDFKMLTGSKILPYVKDPYKELNSYIGLDKAKGILDRIISKAKMDKIRCEKIDKENKKLIKSPMHLAFIGPVGTGKTSTARLFAKILKQKGIIKKSNIVEVGRKNLIGNAMISTSKVVEGVFQAARGGVLFIDEAYSLLDNTGAGIEAINTIVQEMENRRDEVIVILGGYKDRMETFINQNEGMKSRISDIVEFENYSDEELYKIFEKIIRDNELKVNDDAKEFIKSELSDIIKRDDFGTLGNARFIRKIVEKAKLNKDYRLGKLDKDEYTEDELKTIVTADLKESIDDSLSAFNDTANKNSLGFIAA